MSDEIKCPEFHCTLPANHVGHHICGKRGCAVNPRPAQDYNEMLISQAGGDGDNADIVTIRVKKHHADVEAVAFSNVPMRRVHAAIAVLNGDGDGEETELTEEGAHLLAINQAAQQRDLFRKFYPPYAAPGTKEFTTEELFPRVDNPLNVDGDPCGICRECGAVVSNPVKHVTWHNKTLP